MELSQKQFDSLIKIQAWSRGHLVRQEIHRQILEWYNYQLEQNENNSFSSRRFIKSESECKKLMDNEYQMFHQNSEQQLNENIQLHEMQEEQSNQADILSSSLELDKKVKDKLMKHQQQQIQKKEQRTNEYMLFVDDQQLEQQATNKIVPVKKKSQEKEQPKFPQVFPIFSNSQLKTPLANQKEGKKNQTAVDNKEKNREIASKILLEEGELTRQSYNSESTRGISCQKAREVTYHQNPQQLSGQRQDSFTKKQMGSSSFSPSFLSQSQIAQSEFYEQIMSNISRIEIEPDEGFIENISTSREQSQSKSCINAIQQMQQRQLEERKRQSINSQTKNVKSNNVNKITLHNNQMIDRDNQMQYEKLSRFSLESFKSNISLHEATQNLQSFSNNELDKCMIDISPEELFSSFQIPQSIQQLSIRHEYQKYVKAATDIQRVFRGKMSRMKILQYNQIKKAVLIIEKQYLKFKLLKVKRMKECLSQIERCSYTIIKYVKDFEKGELYLKNQFKSKLFDSKVKTTRDHLESVFLSFLLSQESPQQCQSISLETEVIQLKKQLLLLKKQFQKEISEIQLKDQQEINKMHNQFEEFRQFHKDTIRKYITSIQTISSQSCSPNKLSQKTFKENDARNLKRNNNTNEYYYSHQSKEELDQQQSYKPNYIQGGITTNQLIQCYRDKIIPSYFNDEAPTTNTKKRNIHIGKNQMPSNPCTPFRNNIDDIQFFLSQNINQEPHSRNQKFESTQMKETLSLLKSQAERDLNQFNNKIKSVKYNQQNHPHSQNSPYMKNHRTNNQNRSPASKEQILPQPIVYSSPYQIKKTHNNSPNSGIRQTINSSQNNVRSEKQIKSCNKPIQYKK